MPVNNDDKESQKSQEKDLIRHRREEAILLNRFQRVAKARLEQMMARQPPSGDDEAGLDEFRMGDAEQRIFHSISVHGVPEGILAGIVTFGILRKGPVYMARYLYRRKQMVENNTRTAGGAPTAAPHKYAGPTSPNQPPPKTADGYQFSVLPNQINTNSNMHSNNPFQVALRKDFPRSRNIFVRSIWFMFDSMLSLMMGASVCMAYSDNIEDIKDQIVALPLQPGRSLTSDTLCPVIIRELALVRQENSPAYQRLSQSPPVPRSHSWQQQQAMPSHSPSPASIMYFHGIQDFAANCQRRHFVERSIRQQQYEQEQLESMSPSTSFTPVEIPSAILPTAPRWTGDEEEHDDNEANISLDFEDKWDNN
jgi:hypothetical protein